jgi:uncharacterized sporulation protein YeaH/YhbH (DUF444 family)
MRDQGETGGEGADSGRGNQAAESEGSFHWNLLVFVD